MNTPFFLRGTLDISNLIDVYTYKRDFRKEHPDYFDPDGILCFCGAQGQGKTLSAVQYVLKLAERYEKSIIVSNIYLPFFAEANSDRYIQFHGLNELLRCMRSVQNGYNGVVYLIDEIQILFNSLESKNVGMDVITEISQQRKQRKHIVGTSQVFQRLAKPFREQFKYAVLCRCFFGAVQYNTLVDGATAVEDASGHISTHSMHRYFWFHSPDLYQQYDTYAKIERESFEKGVFLNAGSY